MSWVSRLYCFESPKEPGRSCTSTGPRDPERAPTRALTSPTENANQAALGELVDHHRQLLAFVQNRVGDRETAEEILQAAFVRGVEKISDLRDEEKALPWFYQLLRNAIAAHHRQGALERRVLEGFDREGRVDADQEKLLEGVVCDCMHGLLGHLKKEYAELLREVDLGEASIADYARSRGLTPNNTRVRLHRARAALKLELQKTCRTCTEHGCLDCNCRREPV